MRNGHATEVRVLESGDASLLRELLACFAAAFDDVETYCAAQPDDQYLDRLLAGECFFAVVAVCAGRVVGGLTGYELRKFEQARSELYIYDLAVEAAYRREGIATALIQRVRQLASDRGAWTVYVQADVGDGPAVALYSGIGTREEVLHFDFSPLLSD